MEQVVAAAGSLRHRKNSVLSTSWDSGVVWCGVPKAPLPEGKGREVYPRVQVNGRAVCVVCALCVSVFSAAESGDRGTWRRPTRPAPLAQELTRDSPALRLLVQA